MTSSYCLNRFSIEFFVVLVPKVWIFPIKFSSNGEIVKKIQNWSLLKYRDFFIENSLFSSSPRIKTDTLFPRDFQNMIREIKNSMWKLEVTARNGFFQNLNPNFSEHFRNLRLQIIGAYVPYSYPKMNSPSCSSYSKHSFDHEFCVAPEKILKIQIHEYTLFTLYT